MKKFIIGSVIIIGTLAFPNRAIAIPVMHDNKIELSLIHNEINTFSQVNIQKDPVIASIEKYSSKNGIPYQFSFGIAHTESKLNVNAEGPQTKYGKAKGIYQMIDSTAKTYGVDNPFDVEQSSRAANEYLKDLWKQFDNRKAVDQFNNDVETSLLVAVAYNWGPTNLENYLISTGNILVLDPKSEYKLPSETLKYIFRINEIYSFGIDLHYIGDQIL